MKKRIVSLNTLEGQDADILDTLGYDAEGTTDLVFDSLTECGAGGMSPKLAALLVSIQAMVGQADTLFRAELKAAQKAAKAAPKAWTAEVRKCRQWDSKQPVVFAVKGSFATEALATAAAAKLQVKLQAKSRATDWTWSIDTDECRVIAGRA